MSRLASTLMNAVPRLVLASPAHRLMSGRYATLHFAGRRSGRSYHVPVAYHAVSAHGFVISTDSGWWRNLAEGTEFAVSFRGQRRTATAESLTGDAAVEALRGLVKVPGYTKAAGIARIDGAVPEDGLRQAASQRVVLGIELGDQR